MKQLPLKFKALLVIFFFFNGNLIAKDIHILTNDLFGIAGYVKIYNGDEKLMEITKNQSLILKVNDDLATIELTFKWGLRLTKKLEVYLFNKDLIFVYIHLDPAVWAVYDGDHHTVVPEYIKKKYQERREAIELAYRIKKHPLTNYTKAGLIKYLENPKTVNEGFYKAAIMTSYASEAEVGVVKTDEGYTVVYLSGGNKDVWKEGDLKGYFTKTANDNIFRAKWYFENKKSIEGLYFTFENSTIKIIGENGNPDQIFIKHYPMSSLSGAPSKTVTSTNTGFALSNDGLIITTYEIVKNSTNLTIKGINGDFSTPYKAKVVVSDKNNGLAIIQVDEANFKGFSQVPYVLKPTSADVGENVFALGYPVNASMSDEIRLTNGIISSKTGFQGDITAYQISAPVQAGNSGGPLFDKSGSLIGVIQSKQSETENVSYAIKVGYIKNLIDLLPAAPKFSDSNILAGLSLSEQIKTLNKYIYLIEAK
ncbi:S1C family serine protease [Emticicia sp. TH156]|uniref:S1C family serine protease n=1 Tax=Emticicia sp. TH156 TaxID=2067454 RepID=UPI000C76DEA1|nr:serine protease [Emticicia sp. TH156]PLK44677.1 hypothetical protein C0V77_09460 [Emticicia sp. TH156]